MSVTIYDASGGVVPQADIRRARARGLVSGGSSPYDAADRQSAEMAGWSPWLGSPDTETTPYRDLSVARTRDLVRNDAWASGTVARMSDATLGADLRLAASPDYRALARRFGSGFDATWAKEFSDAAEAGWRAWAYDPNRYCDVERRLLFPQMMRLAFRHEMIDGEALGILPWRPDRVAFGRARYATTLQIVDPDRLSNPSMVLDTLTMRGGIELDQDGVPVAYYTRRAHPNDWYAAGNSVTWDRTPRETDWGRPLVIHSFAVERAGQHRPVGGVFTPVLTRMRMLAQYDRVEMQAAIVNAIFGAFLESPFDAADVQASLDDSAEGLSQYQKDRSEFHADRRLMAGNVRLATLYPGEKINTINASRPAAAFDAFEAAMLRGIATATGNAFETVSGDYRGSSYSSARQATNEAWRTITRRRYDFGASFCSPIYGALLEEMIDRDDVPLPRGAPEFAEARAEYARCRWLGPGRGYVDVTKEPEGSRMKIAAGLSTLEMESGENSGADWLETLDQLELEQKEIKARGLNLVFDKGVAQQDAVAPGEAVKQEQETVGPRE